MRIVQKTADHLIVSRECNHPERWPDGFCVVCSLDIERERRASAQRVFREACVDENILQLFPEFRFIEVSGFLVRAEEEQEIEVGGS